MPILDYCCCGILDLRRGSLVIGLFTISSCALSLSCVIDSSLIETPMDENISKAVHPRRIFKSSRYHQSNDDKAVAFALDRRTERPALLATNPRKRSAMNTVHSSAL
ncbi:unnamed protein product, partial [Cyprideis torosa]